MQPCGTEIGFQLSEVNIAEFSDSFQLYNDLMTGDQIDASTADRDSFESDIGWNLTVERNAAVNQRNPHGSTVRRL